MIREENEAVRRFEGLGYQKTDGHEPPDGEGPDEGSEVTGGGSSTGTTGLPHSADATIS